MITSDYVREMARYNRWQNSQLVPFLQALDEAALRQDRGAFFRSIFATLNHLLWGDTIWMSRFDGACPPPKVPAAEHASITASLDEWYDERARMDQVISDWAAGLGDADLQGPLTWYSGLTKREQTRPLALCVTHFFNHQTHHRGQVHAMLTAAGQKAPVTDLPFMPEDV